MKKVLFLVVYFFSLSVSAADLKCLYPLERVTDSQFVLDNNGNPIYRQTPAIVPASATPTKIEAYVQYTAGIPDLSYGLQPSPAAPTYRGYNVNGCKSIGMGGSPYTYLYTWDPAKNLLYSDSVYVDSANNNYPEVIELVFLYRSDTDGTSLPLPPTSIN